MGPIRYVKELNIFLTTRMGDRPEELLLVTLDKNRNLGVVHRDMTRVQVLNYIPSFDLELPVSQNKRLTISSTNSKSDKTSHQPIQRPQYLPEIRSCLSVRTTFLRIGPSDSERGNRTGNTLSSLTSTVDSIVYPLPPTSPLRRDSFPLKRL